MERHFSSIFANDKTLLRLPGKWPISLPDLLHSNSCWGSANRASDSQFARYVLSLSSENIPKSHARRPFKSFYSSPPSLKAVVIVFVDSGQQEALSFCANIYWKVFSASFVRFSSLDEWKTNCCSLLKFSMGAFAAAEEFTSSDYLFSMHSFKFPYTSKLFFYSVCWNIDRLRIVSTCFLGLCPVMFNFYLFTLFYGVW